MASKGLKFTISAVDRTKAVFKGVGKSVKGLSSAVFSLKGALVGLGGAVVIRSIARTNAQFEDLRSGLASVFGSVEEGNKRFREISDFATRTQFSVEDLTKAFITLKGAGIEPTEKLLTTFTDTSASAVDGLGVFEALTRVIARSVGGGLGLEELNQIFDRGIPVFTILTEQLGITRLEVSELGKTAEGSEKIISALITGLDKRFGGATQKRLSNLNVAFSNFGIALRNFQDIIGESGFGQALKNVTSTLTDAISDSDGLAKAIGRVLANVFNKIDESLKSFRETGLDNLKEFLIKATLLTEAFVNNFKAGLESVANAFIDIRNALVFFKEDLKPISIAKSDFSDLVEFIRQIQFETKEAGTQFQKHFGQRLHGDFLTKTNEKFKELRSRLKRLQDASKEFGTTIASGFEDAVFEAKKLSDAIRQIAQDVIRLAYRRAITDPLGEALGGAIKGAIGTVIGSIPARAGGGSVQGGKPYVVGERGMELMVPGRSGTIIPNNALGGSVTVNQTLNIMPSVNDSVRAEIFNALPLIREQSVQAVIEARSRGGIMTKAMGLK